MSAADSPAPCPVEVRVLGPLEVLVDGRSLALGGVKPRSVMALLSFDLNRVVPSDRIVRAVWGDDAPDNTNATLQVHVSNLRRVLGPAAERTGRRELIVTRRPGYVLELPDDALDVRRAEAHIALGRRLVTSSPAEALAHFDDALALWRGDALADLAHEAFAQALAVRVSALRESVLDDRFETALALGRHGELLTDLAGAVATDPTNERRRGLLMVALYRAGKQADALETFQDARRALVEQLGLDPSPALRELEARILRKIPTFAVAPSGQARSDEIEELSTLIGSSLFVPPASLVVDGVTVTLGTTATTIGRRVGCDVVLDDPKASRNHAEIRLAAAGYTLTDVGSTNGTYLNGERVGKRVLRDGDEIRIGSTVMTFVGGSPG